MSGTALSPLTQAAAVTVFALTYAALALPRTRALPIGRPGAALLGATLMVAVGALSPTEALRAPDPETLLLLFGMMLLAGSLEEDGALTDLDLRALRAARGSPRRLLAIVGALAAGLSALLVNDTVCVFLTPLVLRMTSRANLPPMPYLTMLATAANIGSAATLVGNPQNMLLGALSSMQFVAYTLRAGPAVALALGVHLLLLDRTFAAALPATLPATPQPAPPRGRLGVVVGLAVVGALLAGAPMGWAALGGALALAVLRRRGPDRALRAVDWPLIALFAGLFVVVDGLRATGLVERALLAAPGGLRVGDPLELGALTLALTAGANLISNVPLVMVIGPGVPALGPGELVWPLVGLIITFAGNLTLVGSVANLIVSEAAAPQVNLDFWTYLRIGAPATLVSLAVGIPALLLTARAL